MAPDTTAVREDQGVAETKIRTVRVDDELWTAAQEVAATERETVADVIRRALVAYVREHGGTV